MNPAESPPLPVEASTYFGGYAVIQDLAASARRFGSQDLCVIQQPIL